MDGESHISKTLFRWQRRIPPPVRYVWLVTIYLVVWAALDKVSIAFETTPEVQIWYPPSALDFVLLLVFGLRYTPALWLNTLVHEYFVTHRHLNFVTLGIFDLVTTLSYAGASALLLYNLRINPRLRSVRDAIWFIIVAALAAPLVVAWLQVMNFAWSGIIPWSKWLIYMLHYWAGDATGIAMLAPVLLILLRQLPWVWLHSPHEPPATRANLRWPKASEVPLLLAESVALGVGIWAGYGVPRAAHLDYTYFVLLPLVWIALRHGFERAAATVLFINVGVALLASAKLGQSNILALQFGLMATSHSGLFLGAVTTGRRQAEKALRDYAEEMRYNALHDVLTGLPNRALFMDRLGRAVEHGKRYQDYLFAVLFLDLDRFKVINDSLGHILGDQLLIATARRLESCLRPTDTIARIGGDEFTILLEDISDISDTIRVAERIHMELKLPFDLGGQEVFTATSIGIALSATGYSQPSDLVRDADIAMYQAKVRGARYEIFNTSMHERTVARLQMETDLRRAIERMEFLIYYQPLVSLVTGKITGFEALVRWQHPQRGLLCPAKFVLLAEETGLLSLIDQWVMREACRQTHQWSEQMPKDLPLSISVNLANKQFTQPNLIEQISQILLETNLDASRLKLEITENVLMENRESATATLLQLKALGIRLVIDDFGTGYSSLGRLHSFPIDELKIDRSFVSQIGTDEGNLEITETIVTLAQKLSVDVTAEGIETASQLARLRELKCRYGQGYFLSRPLDSVAAEALIMANPQW